MKLTKEDLKTKVSGFDISPELQIELLEDIEDSMEVIEPADTSEIEAAFEELKTKYEDLLNRYKERFLEKVTEEEPAEEEEVKESEVIDVREI